MKKKILTLILLALLLPTIVNADEKCTVISGSGKKIGDEIACGTEHFYVIDSKDTEIKMLAKYNLYVGFNINKIKIDKTKTYIRYECNQNGCYNNATYFFNGETVNSYSEWLNKFNLDGITMIEFPQRSNWNQAFGFDERSENYTIDDITYINKTYDKLYPYYTINEDTEGFGLQNELARGVTGEKGNANYPLYGVIHIFPRIDDYNDYYESYAEDVYDNFENGYTDFILKNDYLAYYGDVLSNKGYDISDIDLISIQEVNDLVNKITNKRLPLSEWYELSLNNEETEEDNGSYYNLGDLKKYLSNDYSWLWNTSYWTKTAVGNINNRDYLEQAYFVSSAGEICYSKADCSSGIPRAGIRPVVTIESTNLKYLIKTQTDGKGTIEVVEEAYGGEAITFRVSAKVGYRLTGLTITTDSGETVEFNEGDITENADGTISIRTNNFTMPYENVLIQARWTSTILNPETSNSLLMVLTIVSVTCITGLTVYRKNKKA